jgi:hypothetical protein
MKSVGFSLFHLQTSVRSNGMMCVQKKKDRMHGTMNCSRAWRHLIVCINVCVCINSYGSWKLQRPVPCVESIYARGGDVHAMMNTSGSGSER